MEIVTGRMKRVEDSLRKPLPKQEHEQLLHEQATLTTVLAAMEAGQPLRQTRHDRRSTQGNQLLPPLEREAAGGDLQHAPTTSRTPSGSPPWPRPTPGAGRARRAWNWNWRR